MASFSQNQGGDILVTISDCGIIMVSKRKGGENKMKLKENERQFLRISEVADMLGVHYNTIWRLIKEGSIPAVKIGRSWHIPVQFVQELQKKAMEKVG